MATHELTQHIMVPTQIHGYTLDVIITRSDDKLVVSNINVAPPSISDHSIIHFNISHQLPPIIRQSVERRSFKNFNATTFKYDLESTDLFKQASLMENPNNVDDLFDLYDSTMESLLDKHAPRRKIILRKVPGCPWFDGTCASSKKQTRRLEYGEFP